MGKKQQKQEVNKSDDLVLSKSAKKRESAALQKLGEELCKLPESGWSELNLPDDLQEALREYAKISDREAARRQRQFIGKIMRSVDGDAIADALQRLLRLSRSNSSRS